MLCYFSDRDHPLEGMRNGSHLEELRERIQEEWVECRVLGWVCLAGSVCYSERRRGRRNEGMAKAMTKEELP